MLKIDINLVFTMINLVILFVLLRKFLFKPVREVMAKRDKEISDSYAAADQTTKDANALKMQYEDQIHSLDAEKEQCIQNAKKKANEEYDRIIEEANQKSEEILSDAKARAKVQTDQEIRKAEEEISNLVKDAASRFAKAQSDERLYDDFLKQVQ